MPGHYFLIAPILTNIVDEMKDFGGVYKKGTVDHHKLNSSSINSQASQVENLLEQLEKVEYSMDSHTDESMYNMIAGPIFPGKSYWKIVNIDKTERELHQTIIQERLSSSSSTVEIMARLNKVNVPVFQSCDEKIQVRSDSMNTELKGNCKLFAKCAIISNHREVDMQSIISKHELSSTPRSFFSADGKGNHGGTGKSKLLHDILEEVPDAMSDTSNVTESNIILSFMLCK